MNPWFAELLERYARALEAAAPWALGLLAGVLAFSVVPRPRAPRARAAAVVVLAGIGALRALGQAWVSDDAFISFRYAKHLADGLGLVFNEGERVEGYTNFLWTVMASVPIAAGLHPAPAMVAVSLASLVALVWLSARLAARGQARPGFPIAACVVALNATMVSFGTSGLETMFAALLVLASVERAESARPLQAGIVGTLAVLAHPDHALFYGGLGVSIALGRDWRALGRYIVPSVLLYVPYLAFRVGYYGDWLPNTYYAKSGGLTYWSQGTTYLVVSAVASGIVALLPLATVGAVAARQRHLARFALFGLVPYLVYVAKVGGDFMLGRLLVPVVAPLAILAELGFCALLARDRRVLGIGGLSIALLSAIPTRTLRRGEKFEHIADEQTFYRVISWSPFTIDSHFQRWGQAIERRVAAAGFDPVLGIGCHGVLGYETDLFIVDTFGLTEKNVARQPLAHRGRPGHEKRASSEYFQTRGVDFSDDRTFPKAYDRFTRFSIEGFPFFLGRYHPGFMPGVTDQSQVTAPDMPAEIDAYAVPDSATRLACDLWFFKAFYFDHNDDRGRRADLLRRVVDSDPSLAGYESFFLSAAPSAEWRPVRRFDFSKDDARAWSKTGRAFSFRTESAPGQRTVVGHEGAFASSYHRFGGDRAEGRLSRRFVVEGEVMTLAVGGGGKGDGAVVRLSSGGRTLFEASGCRSEALGTRVWPVGSLRGEEVTLEIIDAGKGSWGHIVVDEIVQWRRAGEAR